MRYEFEERENRIKSKIEFELKDQMKDEQSKVGS